MKIHLPAYKSGVHDIHESLRPHELELDAAVFPEDIQARLTLDRHDPYLRFRFQLDTRIRVLCDRCLCEFVQNVSASGPMMYVLRSQPSEDPVDDPEIAYVPSNTTDLDVSTELRDLLMLSVPFRHLCNDECRGICPGCGADLNVEPCRC